MEANVNMDPGRKASYKCIEMQMSKVPINNGKGGEKYEGGGGAGGAS